MLDKSRDSSPTRPVVDRFFDETAGYWVDVYRDEGLQGLVYRERMRTAMRWIDELALPPNAGVLELGCGAGLLAAELAGRRLRVTATDSSPEMVKLATERSQTLRIDGSLHVLRADVHQLPFPDGEFELAVALGLLPWVDAPREAIAEMARVLAPGGWLILTADNRARLNFLVEPRENPLLMPLKLALRAGRRAAGQHSASAVSHLHLPAEVDEMLASAGMQTIRRTTIGFGPFTFLGRRVLPEPTGFRLHASLHALSRRRALVLRRVGWHYLIAARKPRQ